MISEMWLSFSVKQSVFLCLSLLNIHVGICLVLVSFICCVLFSWSPSTSVFLHLDLFIYLSIYLAMHLYIYLSLILSTISNDIFIYLYIYFFVSSITILLAGLSHPPFLLLYLVLLLFSPSLYPLSKQCQIVSHTQHARLKEKGNSIDIPWRKTDKLTEWLTNGLAEG